MAWVVLVGLPGSGKSTVGRALARRHNWTWTDTDDMVSERGAAELLRTEGEVAFRLRELQCLQTALEQFDVVSTGGGVVTTDDARQLLRDAACVWLRADHDQLMRRLGDADRPLLGADPDAALRSLAHERDPLYAEVAQRTIDANQNFDDVVDELDGIVGEWTA